MPGIKSAGRVAASAAVVGGIGPVQLAMTPGATELRAVVRSFLEATSPEAEVRRLMVDAVPFDRDLWVRMASELGVQGLALDESVGGQGYGFAELAVVVEEAGRALLCAPLLSTVVGSATLLDALGPDAAGDPAGLLAELAAGRSVVAVAVPVGGAGFDAAELTVRADVRDGSWRLDGHVGHVVDGHLADEVLVVATTSKGPGVFRCAPDASGLTVAPLSTLDLTRTAAAVTFDETPAEALGAPGEVGDALARTLDVMCVALAVESVGGAQRCLEMAVAHAKRRVQFGRPIGSFQAVKHRCADMLIAVETARSAAAAAVWAVDASHPVHGSAGDVDLATEASLAKAAADEAYVAVANSTIQVHGGIGFTWEHPAHLYLKRATSTAATFGDVIAHRGRLGDRVDL